jgi:hypothetical protein
LSNDGNAGRIGAFALTRYAQKLRARGRMLGKLAVSSTQARVGICHLRKKNSGNMFANDHSILLNTKHSVFESNIIKTSSLCLWKRKHCVLNAHVCRSIVCPPSEIVHAAAVGRAAIGDGSAYFSSLVVLVLVGVCVGVCFKSWWQYE